MPIFPFPPSTSVVGPPGPTTATPVGGLVSSGYDLTLRADDREFATVWVLADNGMPLVIPTGATVALTLSVMGDADTVTGGGPVDIVDGSNGKVSYAWQAGDVAVPGSYWGTFTVTFDGGSRRTYPNARYLRILVTAGLG